MGQCHGRSSVIVAANVPSRPSTHHSETKLVSTPLDDVILSPDELLTLMNQQTGNLHILDTTVNGAPSYESNHIEDTVHMDITNLGEDVTPTLRVLPSPDVFQAYVRSIGINSDSDIVLYDQAEANAGYLTAGRAWFLFRYFGHNKVRILDGGLRKWKDADHKTTSDTPRTQEGDFTANVQSQLLKVYEDMRQNLNTHDYQVVDVRARNTYDRGHIDGAMCVSFTESLIDQTNHRLNSLSVLRAAFKAGGVNVGLPLIAMCKTGMMSCTALVALTMMGYPNVPLYFGSWADWEEKSAETQQGHSEI